MSITLNLKRRKPKPSNLDFGLSSTVMLLGLLLLSLTSIACVKTTRLYPITDKDIYFQENGNVCFSEYYMKEVLKAKVK